MTKEKKEKVKVDKTHPDPSEGRGLDMSDLFRLTPAMLQSAKSYQAPSLLYGRGGCLLVRL